MIITTTQHIEGKQIKAYCGIVFGEVVLGVNFLKDFMAGFTNFFGGRSGTYEKELIDARASVLRELEDRARAVGADAVVGVKLDYEIIGANGNNMMMVIASGTGVQLD